MLKSYSQPSSIPRTCLLAKYGPGLAFIAFEPESIALSMNQMINDLALLAPQTRPAANAALISSAPPPLLQLFEPCIVSKLLRARVPPKIYHSTPARTPQGKHQVFACDTCEKTCLHVKNDYEHKILKHVDKSFFALSKDAPRM